MIPSIDKNTKAVIKAYFLPPFEDKTMQVLEPVTHENKGDNLVFW